MKKIILITIALLMVPLITVFADNATTADLLMEESNNIQNLYNDFYLFNYDGETYIFDKGGDVPPKTYNKATDDFFFGGAEDNATSYKQINDIYMAIYNQASYRQVFAGGDSWKGYSNFYVRFYDLQLNLISETNLKSYISDYGYYNDRYYCTLSTGTGTKYYVTANMIDWEETDKFVADMTNSVGEIYYTKNSVSFDKCQSFWEIKYESSTLNGRMGIITDVPIIISFVSDMSNDTINCYISKDKINYIKVTLENLFEADELAKYNGYNPISCWYFADDKLVVEALNGNTAYIMLDDINKLDKMPRIRLKDCFLSFEQPPVIQDDRTLIPIRFLFEQMGSTVDWDGDTQTATISQGNTAVSFAINDTDADVNGQTVSMDVPAQLINGKTMVPLRFLSENLGYDVDWDGETRIITIE